MDRTAASSTVSSTITSSSVSDSSSNRQYLELSLISAEGLPPVTKSMRTYAMAWLNPNRKYTTGTDHDGHVNPTWNDKFRFRLDNQTLANVDQAAVTVEIYALSRFRDAFVGSARLPIADFVHNEPNTLKFLSYQVQRQSGTPQGKLQIGAAIIDGSMRRKSMRLTKSEDGISSKRRVENAPLKNDVDVKIAVQPNLDDVVLSELEKKKLEEKISQWWKKSIDLEECEEEMICNSSIIQGSELCSDIGPSPSVVANQLAAFRPDRSDISSALSFQRRHADMGLFTCFGAAVGIELRVTCGAPHAGGNKPPGSTIGKTTKKLISHHTSA